jgi:hypothetical protein
LTRRFSFHLQIELMFKNEVMRIFKFMSEEFMTKIVKNSINKKPLEYLVIVFRFTAILCVVNNFTFRAIQICMSDVKDYLSNPILKFIQILFLQLRIHTKASVSQEENPFLCFHKFSSCTTIFCLNVCIQTNPANLYFKA